MSELEKMRPLAQYIGWFEAAYNWYTLLSIMESKRATASAEDRAGFLKGIRKTESMLGSVVLHISGLYPLESGWELDDE